MKPPLVSWIHSTPMWFFCSLFECDDGFSFSKFQFDCSSKTMLMMVLMLMSMSVSMLMLPMIYGIDLILKPFVAALPHLYHQRMILMMNPLHPSIHLIEELIVSFCNLVLRFTTCKYFYHKVCVHMDYGSITVIWDFQILPVSVISLKVCTTVPVCSILFFEISILKIVYFLKSI